MNNKNQSPLSRIGQWVRELPHKGPFRRDFWRSPLRGPWFTSVLSFVLLIGLPIVFITGLLSSAAWNPDLGGTNNQTPNKDWLAFYLGWEWPTRPIWLYRLNQGIHLLFGLALIPIVFAKMWSVMPTLFKWPPADSIGHGLERLGHLMVIGGIYFQFFTGLLFIQNWAVFSDHFNRMHYFGAWVFIAGLILHVGTKLPTFRKGLKSRSLRKELRTPLSETKPEPLDEEGLVSNNPAAPTVSRRGALAMIGGTSLAVMALAFGQILGQDWRWLAFLSPRAQVSGDGPNDFRVNKTAKKAHIKPEEVGPDWRLELVGTSIQTFSREELLAMPQYTSSLPIACLEGWSTGNQDWRGVRLRDLAELAGMPDAGKVLFESLEKTGRARMSYMRRNQIQDPLSLLALGVNGVDISLDHGYPARAIVPASVGNRNTKWVKRITFMEEA